MKDSSAAGRADTLFFFLALFVPFLIYGRTLCPSVFTGDSGELITAAHTLGIPHPPGYPLFCLLGKLFTFLPFGNVAYRLNLFSAFFSALTAGMVYLILLRLFSVTGIASSGRPLFALSGACFYGLLKDVWFQSLSAEVYTLHAFFVALLLYLSIRWVVEKSDSLFFLITFLFGLGLGNHQTLLVFAPLLFLMILLEGPARLKSAGFLAGSCFFFLIGLSVYLYLPLRALSDPPMHWGVIPNWKSILNHVLRFQYRGIGATRNLLMYGAQLRSFGVALDQQAPALLWGFVPFGLWRLWKASPRLGFFAAFLFLEVSFLLILAMNFEPGAVGFYLIRPFYLPAWLVLSLFWGVGMAEVISFCFKRTPSLRMLSLSFPLFLLLVHFPANDLSRHRIAEDYGRDLLATVEENGILFISGDDAQFILAYLQQIERLRPDVSVYGLEQPGSFPILQKKSFFKFLSSNPRAPVYTNLRPLSYPGHPGNIHLKPRGILYRLVPEGKEAPSFSWETYRIRDPEQLPAKDLFEKYILFHYLSMKTQGLLASGEKEEAEKLLEVLYTFADEEAYLHLQLGLFYLHHGRSGEAFAAFQSARRLIPSDPEVWNGFGIALGQLGRYPEAIHWLQKTVQYRPKDASLAYNLGVSFGNLGRYEEAIFWWRRALLLEKSPRGQEVLQGKIREAKALLNQT